MHLDVLKICQHDRYSVIVIALRKIFALSHNASTLWRKVSLFTVIVLGLWKQIIAFHSYGSDNMANAVTLRSNVADLCFLGHNTSSIFVTPSF